MAVHRVLIVEDNSDIRRLVRVALQLPGSRERGEHVLEVHEAVNGQQALDMARQQPPQLVLLDVAMPGGLDGYEVCEQIRQDPALAGCKVLLLTARGQASDVERGRLAGADAYVVKPFRPAQIVECVWNMLG